MMENTSTSFSTRKRSVGVTTIAWLTIILSIFNLFYSFDFKSLFEVYKSFSKNFIVLMIAFSIMSSTIGVVVGIGLLKLKDSMRRLGVAINSLDILFGVPLFFLSLNAIKQYVYTVTISEITKSSISLDINTIANFIFYFIVFLIWTLTGISVLFIIFFTRPKVKEQFR